MCVKKHARTYTHIYIYICREAILSQADMPGRGLRRRRYKPNPGHLGLTCLLRAQGFEIGALRLGFRIKGLGLLVFRIKGLGIGAWGESLGLGL